MAIEAQRLQGLFDHIQSPPSAHLLMVVPAPSHACFLCRFFLFWAPFAFRALLSTLSLFFGSTPTRVRRVSLFI